MLEKRYQKVFTQTRFNECQFMSEKKNSLIFSTILWSQKTVEDINLSQNISKYNTYIINQKQLINLPDLRIFDSKTTKIQNIDFKDKTQPLIDIFACNNLEVNNQMFSKSHKEYFDNSIVNLIDKNSYKSVILTLRTSLMINQNKDRLYLQDFKCNEDQFDVLNIMPKKKTNYQLKKVHKVPLLDINQTSFKNMQLNNLSVVNEQEVLMHLGYLQQICSKSTLLCKFDILNKSVQWKYRLNRFQTYFNRNIHISQNSFLNGIYILQNHSSILQLFDYRMKGPALTVLSSDLPKNADFNHLERIDNTFKFMSLFIQKGGACNLPFIFDIRYPQHYQMISFSNNQNKLSFAMKIKYQKPYLFTIQKQYQNYKFKKAKISKYYFQYPSTI